MFMIFGSLWLLIPGYFILRGKSQPRARWRIVALIDVLCLFMYFTAFWKVLNLTVTLSLIATLAITSIGLMLVERRLSGRDEADYF